MAEVQAVSRYCCEMKWESDDPCWCGSEGSTSKPDDWPITNSSELCSDLIIPSRVAGLTGGWA